MSGRVALLAGRPLLRRGALPTAPTATAAVLVGSTRLFTSSRGGDDGSDDDHDKKKLHSSTKHRATPSPSASSVPTATASTASSSPWQPSGGTGGDAGRAKAQATAASARLTNLFHTDRVRQELRVGGGGGGGASAAARGARLVFDDDDDGDDGGLSRFAVGVDEDTDNISGGGMGGDGLLPRPQAGLAVPGATQERLVALEQELLDDDFLFFPPAVVGGGDAAPLADTTDAAAAAAAFSSMEEGTVRAAAERYVPGQQIIPPGLTRYRVDVQYQGADFDGWFKSTSRRWEVLEQRPDGTVARRRPASPSEAGAEDPFGSGVGAEGMQARHHARSVLEDALAVALDVPAVSVVAAAIPEVGVTVRRLTCHVDLPSEIEMQPRTIIQRATLWLQARGQPLAILSCAPCRNQDFHARHSGVRRVYCYRILNRVAPPLFDAGLQWHVDRHLDVARMQRFAAAMEGTHDYGYFADPKMANALRRAAVSGGGAGRLSTTPMFTEEHAPLTADGRAPWERPSAPKADIDKGLSHLDRAAALPTFNQYGQRVLSYSAKPREFLKARTNLPTIRTVDRIEVVRQEDEVLVWFVGQSFLRHQIRNMVAVLKASGHGLWDEHELQHALSAGFEVSRKKFARERLPPAPVHGLTLWDVEYPNKHQHDYTPFVDAGPYEEVNISAIN